MKISIIAAALAALIVSGGAYAADAPAVPAKIPGSLAIVTDIERSIENETTKIEAGLEYSNQGLNLSFKPKYDWDAEEVSNIEFAASYDIKLGDKITISPYGEYHTNDEFEATDKVIGIKSKIAIF